MAQTQVRVAAARRLCRRRHVALGGLDNAQSRRQYLEDQLLAVQERWREQPNLIWNNYLAPFAISYNPDLGSLGYLGFCLSTFLINHDTKVAVYTGSILTVGPGATKSLSVPVFEVGPNGFIRVAGKVKTKGIISYLSVSGHESGHEAAAFQGVEVSYIDGVPPNGVKDSDGDGIPDVWEIAHHLDPENPDTGGFYTATGGLDDGKGDRESLATMVGLGRVTKYSGLWQQDWADLGIQYGKRSSYVPFEYDSLDLSQIPSNKIPATVLTDWP